MRFVSFFATSPSSIIALKTWNHASYALKFSPFILLLFCLGGLAAKPPIQMVVPQALLLSRFRGCEEFLPTGSASFSKPNLKFFLPYLIDTAFAQPVSIGYGFWKTGV